MRLLKWILSLFRDKHGIYRARKPSAQWHIVMPSDQLFTEEDLEAADIKIEWIHSSGQVHHEGLIYRDGELFLDPDWDDEPKEGTSDESK